MTSWSYDTDSGMAEEDWIVRRGNAGQLIRVEPCVNDRMDMLKEIYRRKRWPWVEFSDSEGEADDEGVEDEDGTEEEEDDDDDE